MPVIGHMSSSGCMPDIGCVSSSGCMPDIAVTLGACILVGCMPDIGCMSDGLSKTYGICFCVSHYSF